MWVADGDDYISKSSAPAKDMSPKEIRTGQALNVVATIGGLNAMRMASGEFRHAIKNQTKHQQPMLPGMPRRTLRQVGGAVKQGLKTKSGKVGLAATGGMMGLHGLELTGDAIAARSLNNQYKKTQVKKASFPSHAFHIKHTKRMGKMRVTGMVGKDHFIVLDNTDTKRVYHRSQLFFPKTPKPKPPIQPTLPFGKAMPKAVPDQLSSILPGSTVRAYDNSHKHKLRAAAGNIGAKGIGAGIGGAVGIGLATVAGKKLKPLQNATRLAHGGLQIGEKSLVKPRSLTISRDMKRGWAQSSIVGSTAGAAGGYSGNRQLKRVQRDKTYGYGR